MGSEEGGDGRRGCAGAWLLRDNRLRGWRILRGGGGGRTLPAHTRHPWLGCAFPARPVRE